MTTSAITAIAAVSTCLRPDLHAILHFPDHCAAYVLAVALDKLRPRLASRAS